MGWDCTALAVAAFRGHDDIVRKLIQAGAKADMQDKVRGAVWASFPLSRSADLFSIYMQKGKTALHYADEAMKFMCVIALLGAGASPFIKDKVVFVCILALLPTL
jgi:ankyrin repeat protein